MPGYRPEQDRDRSPEPAQQKRQTADPGPRIAVIVPIYNTERHVEKCLRSIMTQTMREIEIICVDDRSPDKSSAIVDMLAGEDDRIRLIRHEINLGLGGARNTGINAARAPFVIGVDSDDWITPDMMARLWEASGNGTADITSCGMAVMQDDGTGLFNIAMPEARFHNIDNEIDIFNLLKPSFCNKLIRKSLFTDHAIAFPEHLLFEDLATTPRLLRFARDIRVIPDLLYCYVRHAGSITNSTSIRHIMDYFRVFDILSEFLAAEGLTDRYETEFRQLIANSLHFHANQLLRVGPDDKARLQDMRFMLLLKLAYLEYDAVLHDLPETTLRQLILRANSRKNVNRMVGVTPPAPGSPSST